VVEQLAFNQRVVGSIPSALTMKIAARPLGFVAVFIVRRDENNSQATQVAERGSTGSSADENR
jgi:hypothetical protein